MATYVDRAAIADDPVFQKRVKVALMTTAIISGLTPQGVNESDVVYKFRVKFSINVIFGNPDQYLQAFVNGLTWNPTGIPGMVDVPAAAADLTAAGDAQIQAAVNAVFNFMTEKWWAQ